MCSAERVTASIRESLARLQLDYVDLIQCHDIEFTHLDQARVLVAIMWGCRQCTWTLVCPLPAAAQQLTAAPLRPFAPFLPLAAHRL